MKNYGRNIKWLNRQNELKGIDANWSHKSSTILHPSIFNNSCEKIHIFIPDNLSIPEQKLKTEGKSNRRTDGHYRVVLLPKIIT